MEESAPLFRRDYYSEACEDAARSSYDRTFSYRLPASPSEDLEENAIKNDGDQPGSLREDSENVSVAETFIEKCNRRIYGTFSSAPGAPTSYTTLQNVNHEKDEWIRPEIINETQRRVEIEKEEIVETINKTGLSIHLAMAVFVAIISQFLVGYNISVMNIPQSIVFPGHSTLIWSVSVASYAIGAPFGAIIGGSIADSEGRKTTMLVNIWVFLVGGVIMSLSPNVYWLIPGRLTTGFATGITSVVVPIYLGEISPPALRGTLGSCTQFAIVLGIFICSGLAFALATAELWRFFFLISPLLCVLQLVLFPFFFESPVWILNKDGNSEEAKEICDKLHGLSTQQCGEIVKINQDIKQNIEEIPANESKGLNSIFSILSDPKQRVFMISCLVLRLTQQLSGINAIFYYSSTMFEGVIAHPLVGSCLVAFIHVVATFVALKIMDVFYRRQLLLVSLGGMIVSCLFIILGLNSILPKIVALIAVMANVSFFALGVGPIPWLIVVEMFDSENISTAMSVITVAHWVSNFLVGLLFPIMEEKMGALCFLPFFIGFNSILYFYIKLLT